MTSKATASIPLPSPLGVTGNRPPGSRLPLPVQTAAWIANPIAFMKRNSKRYGQIFRLKMYPFGKLVVVSSPAAIKQIFTADPNQLRAGEGNGRAEIFEPILGASSLLLLDGAEHMRHRKLMLPSFHGERMKSYGEIMVAATERSLASWPTGEPFPLRPRMQEITLDIILRAVFGIRGEERVERVRELIADLVDETNKSTVIIPFLRKGLRRFGAARKFYRYRDTLDRLLYEEIADRRHDPAIGDRDDILSLLIQGRFEDGGSMTDMELRDELMTLLLAGHETTATSLAWAFEQLFRNPDVAAKLDAAPDTYTWLPFGGGVRRCIGASFATYEMRIVLKTILSSVRLRPAREKPEPIVRRHITYVPKHGAMAILERRSV